VSDRRKAFQLASRVSGISDDWYWSHWNLWCLLQEYHGRVCDKFRPCQSAGENFGCTLMCRLTKAGITNKLWEMPGILCIIIWRTAGVIQDSCDVHEQSISLNSEYDSGIIVHYHFWIILAVIFINIIIYALQHSGYEKKMRVIQTQMLVYRNNNPTKLSNDINPTRCQCHPLHLHSHQGHGK